MRGYLSADSVDGGDVPVRSRTAVYRDPDRGQEIVAETDDGVVPLGVADVTVSRRGDSGAPVVIVPREERIEIRNNGNANGVTVVSAGERTEVSAGRVESVTTDAAVSIGYRTELQLQIERDARLEQNVVHRGEGDVVMGDLTDRSTTVGDDNVMNRTDVGEAGQADGPDRADGATASAGTDGGRATGEGGGGRESESGDEGGGPAGGHCPDCGAETRPSDAYCSGCGRKLAPDEGDTQQFCQRHERTYSGDVCPECARERTAE
jgi:hypothetical protein